ITFLTTEPYSSIAASCISDKFTNPCSITWSLDATIVLLVRFQAAIVYVTPAPRDQRRAAIYYPSTALNRLVWVREGCHNATTSASMRLTIECPRKFDD